MLTFIYLLAATAATGNAPLDYGSPPSPAIILKPAAPPPVILPPPAPTPVAKRLNPTPKGNTANWIGDATKHPDVEAAKQRGMIISYLLTVLRDGRAANCTIVSSSGSTTLDQAICNSILRRARFNPQLDDQANPTSGKYRGQVIWPSPSPRVPALP